MPYIKKEKREGVMENQIPGTPGELAYLLTVLCNEYTNRYQPVDYASYATVVGVLELVKDEYTRRLVHPYENQKCFDNGDVF